MKTNNIKQTREEKEKIRITAMKLVKKGYMKDKDIIALFDINKSTFSMRKKKLKSLNMDLRSSSE